jgi:hypothetical protein
MRGVRVLRVNFVRLEAEAAKEGKAGMVPGGEVMLN